MLVCPINTGVFYNPGGGNGALSGDTLLTIAAGFNVQKFYFGKITPNSMEWQQTQFNYLGKLTRYNFQIGK